MDNSWSCRGAGPGTLLDPLYKYIEWKSGARSGSCSLGLYLSSVSRCLAAANSCLGSSWSWDGPACVGHWCTARKQYMVAVGLAALFFFFLASCLNPLSGSYRGSQNVAHANDRCSEVFRARSPSL
ncbi:hypothetical protein LY78DRAFT_196463 [Colletotrichum sublineola]|nr:hypothetical protein LY78DRAFT_196463 [Colletotrichum sublineola]